MLLYTMLYIVLAYLMLFAALTNSVCLNNASFFFLFKYFLCQGYELSGEIALKKNKKITIIIVFIVYCNSYGSILTELRSPLDPPPTPQRLRKPQSTLSWADVSSSKLWRLIRRAPWGNRQYIF